MSPKIHIRGILTLKEHIQALKYIQSYPEASYVQIRKTDTGVTISMEFENRILEVMTK